MKVDSKPMNEANAIRTHGNRIRKIYQFGAVLIAVAMISSALTLMTIGDGPSGFTTEIGPGSMVEDASYIIFYDAGEELYFAKNGTTGKMEFQSANATLVIQSSMDANPPGKIYIAGGDYPINYRLMVPSNTGIFGGVDTVLILDDGVNDRMIVNADRTSGNSNITISRLSIDGNRLGQTELGEIDAWGNAGCLDFRLVTDLEVSNCIIINPHETGIETTFCHNVRIHNNRISGSGDDGIGINEMTHNATVYGNIIDNAGTFDPYGGSNGIELQDGASHISVMGNVINGTYIDGIQVSTHAGSSGVHNFTIVANTLTGSDGTGIKVSGRPDALVRDFVVSSNTISATGARGLTAYDAQRGVLSSNLVSFSGLSEIGDGGIWVSDSEEISVTSNSVLHSLYGGIWVDTCNGVLVDGNLLEHNVWDNLYVVDSSNVSLTNNMVLNTTGQEAIQIESTTDFIVNANTVMNARKGIDIDDCSYGVVSSNLVKYNREHGIHIVETSSNITVSWNTVNDNGAGEVSSQVGIGIRGDYCRVAWNHCEDTGAGTQLYGIYVYAGSDYNNITYNTLLNHATDNIGLSETTSFIAYNVGYVTEKASTATITGAVNTVVVTHGMASTPVYVAVVGNNAGIGDVSVTTIGATTFTISFESQPGGSTWTFYWYAQTW